MLKPNNFSDVSNDNVFSTAADLQEQAFKRQREEDNASKSAPTPVATPLTPTVLALLCGGFGDKVLSRLFQLLLPINPVGNAFINCPEIRFLIRLLDTWSPGSVRHLDQARQIFGDEYELVSLNSRPVGAILFGCLDK